MHPKSTLEILHHHLKGGKFEYLSLKYEDAVNEFTESVDFISFKKFRDAWNLSDNKITMDEIPKEIKDKHMRWRLGKVRKILFTPSGSIDRVYVGAKYARPFRENNLHEIRLLK